MEYSELLKVALDFATAILLGALIGIEREKHKTEEGEADGVAGLRTFTLLALFGAAAAWVARSTGSPWVLAVALLCVGAFIVAGYFVAARANPQSTGLTTEVAAVVVFVLGAMVMLGHEELAIALGVVTTAVLAYKQPLHGFVAKLGWDDVYAGLRLLIATFIALPLLPDRPIDPWGALNPYALWLLVILISGLSLIGYVLTRLLGPSRGAALTGLTGGLVSSTAVTLSFAKEGRDRPQSAASLACGILLAWAVMFVRVIILVAAVNRTLLPGLIAPFAAMGAVAGGIAAVLYFRGREGADAAAESSLKVQNPFSLTQAAKFAAFFAVVLLAAKIAQEHFAARGLYVVAALAGLTDVDAITLSMAELARNGDARIAVIAIVIAALTNTIVKTAMALVVAGPSFAKPLLAAAVLIPLAGLGAVYFL
ncbi:MAG: MgtC/SapB family protein [Methyloceanibacter sp.]